MKPHTLYTQDGSRHYAELSVQDEVSFKLSMEYQDQWVDIHSFNGTLEEFKIFSKGKPEVKIAIHQLSQ